MEQVKKDMEADEKLKKDWDRVQDSSEKIRQHGARQEERLRDLGDNMKSVSSKTSDILSQWKQRAEESMSSASRTAHDTTEQNESLKKAREFMRAGVESGAAGSRTVISRTRGMFNTVVDSTSKTFSYLGEDKAEKLKQWKSSRDAAAAAAARAEEQASESAEKAAEGSREAPQQPAEANDALVVSKAHSSSWDRFGAGLRDMPFLSSVFENPLFDRLFGESEIAASIREMKEVDYGFHLEDFAEDIEYVVAPHIIKTYLEGDQEALEKHCGEAAFAAVNASIKTRLQQKLSLDTTILAGPKEVELKGAKLMEKGPPCFIWTFNMQQVNCLRDHHGEIVEGAVDDIRTVCYAMAVTRHPDINDANLEYPWQVSELAILWNQPSF